MRSMVAGLPPAVAKSAVWPLLTVLLCGCGGGSSGDTTPSAPPPDDTYGTWAASGEIDIMEARNLGGAGGNTVSGTLHYGGEWPDNVFSGNEYVVPGSATDEFHLYALEWGPNEIRWYVDDVLYAMQNFWRTASADYPAPFDQPFYILLNVAVGGTYPGAPSPSTVFPVTMEVDFVRVFSGGG